MLQQGILGRRQILKTTVFWLKSSLLALLTESLVLVLSYKTAVNLSINLKCTKIRVSASSWEQSGIDVLGHNDTTDLSEVT